MLSAHLHNPHADPIRTNVLYDNHMHTPLCKHAKGLPVEYAQTAIQQGLAGIVMTCHNPLPGNLSQSVRMGLGQFDEYVQLVHNAAKATQGQVDIRLGLECDYFPGLEPFLEHQLGLAKFHHVLGSVHCQIGYYKEMFPAASSQSFQKQYFTHLAQAAESELFDTISHPDLVKFFVDAWDANAIMDHICICLDRIAKTGVAMELNTSSTNPEKINEFKPGPAMLREMAKRHIPVVLGSDAHQPDRVAFDFIPAIDALRQAGYQDVSYFLDRKRHVIALDQAQSLLKNAPTHLP